MSVSKKISDDKKEFVIKVKGKFDFSYYEKFSECYADAPKEVELFILDFKDTIYIDSSALSMILLLKEHAEKKSSKVKIVNATANVKKLLELANFHKLFEVE